MTALNKQALREAAQEEIMLSSVSDTSDAWQDEASPEAVLALLDELEVAENRIAELEVRDVELPKLKMLSDYLAEVTQREREDILVGVKLEFHRMLTAAGIGVKGE